MLGNVPRPINLAARGALAGLAEPARGPRRDERAGETASPPLRRKRYATLGVQVLPPSLVFRMVPKPPTIQPLFWS